MKKWFTDLSIELNDLRPLIYRKRGIIFKKHVYSVDDLLEDEVFYNIRATFGVIEENMKQWQKHGSVDYELLGVYGQLYT